MKILVITSIYPGAGMPDSYTPVVHYFVKEWVKMGHDVRVIHSCTYFPWFYYKTPKWVKNLLQNKVGIPLPEKRLYRDQLDEYEGVRTYRIAMKKVMPMGSFSTKVLYEGCEKAEYFIEREHFSPEVIISHWLNPQIVIMSHLKTLTGATTVMVIHGIDSIRKDTFSNWDKLVADVDIWGFRSLKAKNSFEKLFFIPRYCFVCPSGVPEYFTRNVPCRSGHFTSRFVLVGALISRKYPDKAIEGIASANVNKEFIFNIVGDGAMRNRIVTDIEKKGLQGKVHILGKLPRDRIVDILDMSDVFVLISRGEVFGLVYIEAMARGCIVIASRDEGMDGIIVNGENGFLCEAGNSTELVDIIQNIARMSDSQRKEISDKAIATSLKFTDIRAASNYINTIKEYNKLIREGR